MSAWGNDDIIKGLQFLATLQLRTPLRVLLRHGEVHTDRNTRPPAITREGAEAMWAGIWLPKVFDGPPGGTMASDVGQIPADGGNYLPFLVAVREIVELSDSIESRTKWLREKPMVGNWKTYVEKHGGVDK
ncbi:MAG: hypothetical protein Q7S69_07460 [Nitrosomonadaceae bacterium]|nr:hypothetical protein [Nitrosomonadaceae bacterium]